jgi:hypothetical protein
MNRHLKRPIRATVVLATIACSMAACRTAAVSDTGDADDAASGACLVGDADCDETGADRCLPELTDCVDAGPTERDALVEAAADLLGRPEADLPDDVRIGRRGDESPSLSDDTVLGRRTVELDDTDGSGFRVVAVTIELPDGPERLELTPG